MKRVNIIISGDVQGVFFRAFVRDKANNLGLKGYVKNIEDGKVEAIVEGHEAKINKLVEICKEGPVGSRIEKIEVKIKPYKGEFKEFKIRT